MTSVSQVGTDRILELQFSDGQYRLFLEFYAGGNIILTDKELSILSLLRLVPEGQDQEELRIGLKYSVESRQNHNGTPLLTEQRVRSGLNQALTNGIENSDEGNGRSKRGRGNGVKDTLARCLHEFPPVLLDHALRLNEFEMNTPIKSLLTDEKIFAKLMLSLRVAKSIADNLTKSLIVTGYIVARSQKVGSMKASDLKDVSQPAHGEALLYDEFQPFKPQQPESDPTIVILEHQGYNKTVDEFFSSLETQKLESRLTEKEAHAMRKIESAKLDHKRRLGGLQQLQESNAQKAQAIEGNLQKVEEAMTTINSLVAQGVGWREIAQIIELEQKQHNEVAMIIKLPLKLNVNTITLCLACTEDVSDFEGDETDSEASNSDADRAIPFEGALVDKHVAVDVNLALSPWSNARQYYEQKKTAVAKEQRTLLSSEKALKNTERKINADLKRGLENEKDMMRPKRQTLWFEKFLYFISSEGYLVIGGKDSQQNDILYAKHLRKGDVYVHADLNGAAPIIIQNKPGLSHDPIPPSTLSQAGTLSVCTSSAWESKAVMSAWWVLADQVTKIASNGDYLQPGNFNILGQKNFLPPTQLQIGFGVVFHISEESKAKHIQHRVHNDVARTVSMDASVADQDAIEAKHLVHGSIDGQANTTSDNKTTTEKETVLEFHQGEDVDSGQDEDKKLGTGEVAVQHSMPATGQTYSTCQTVADEGTDEGSIHDTYVAVEPARPNDSREYELQAKKHLENVEPRTVTAHQVRGKQKKHHKLKTKYLEQDDEDRTLALRLLGSAAKQEDATNNVNTRDVKEHESTAARERRQELHTKTAMKSKAMEELHQRILESDNEQLDDNGPEQPDDLDLFVGAILPGDEVFDALIMCGPWDAISSRCGWKVKLQPGSVKKGKAVREILGSWNGRINSAEKKVRPIASHVDEAIVMKDQSRRMEGQLIQNFREAEIVGTVPVGKVRIVMGSNETNKSKGQSNGKAKRGGKGNKRR